MYFNIDAFSKRNYGIISYNATYVPKFLVLLVSTGLRFITKACMRIFIALCLTKDGRGGHFYEKNQAFIFASCS